MSVANAIRAGRAYVELFTRDEGFERGLREAQVKLNNFGQTSQMVGKRLIGLGAAIAIPSVAAIKAASDMEESMNKFNVVFGESSTAMKQWSDDFAARIGRSKLQIADFMASSQDLFVPLGFAAEEAQGLSKQITQLSIDLASFNNLQDADVLRDLHAALTGSGEVMKKYGVIVSEAAVKQEALNMQLDPKNLTEVQKVQARLNIIMAGTTAAQGDAERSAGSFANQMKALEAAVSDTAVAIGQSLLPAVTPLVTDAKEAAVAFSVWAESNGETVESLVGLAVKAAALGVALVALGKTAELTAYSVGTLRKAMIFLQGNPIVASIAAIVVALKGLQLGWNAVAESVTGYRKELERTKELQEELAKLNVHGNRAERTLATAEEIADPREREKFLREALDRENAEIVGAKALLEQLKKQRAAINAENRDGFWGSIDYAQRGHYTRQIAEQEEIIEGLKKNVHSIYKATLLATTVPDAVPAAENAAAAAVAPAAPKANPKGTVNPLSQWFRDADKAAKENTSSHVLNRLKQPFQLLGELPGIFLKSVRDSTIHAAANVGAGSDVAAAAAAASGVARSAIASRNTALDARSSEGIAAIIAATSGGEQQQLQMKMLTELQDQTSALAELLIEQRKNKPGSTIELTEEYA